MHVDLPRIYPTGDKTRVDAAMQTARGSISLWYEVDAAYTRHLIATRLDGFAVAALMIAMEKGEPELVLNGPVSERLLHSLQSQIEPLFKVLNPMWHEVTIKARAVEPSPAPERPAVVTGFSGGVDSFFTIAEYLTPERSPSYRLTHLLFCNVGSHGRGDGGRRLFHERWNLINAFGTSIGLPIVRVDSNLDDLLDTRFERTHVARNASAVLALQGLFTKYLYSSTYRYQDCYFAETDDMAHADPATVHTLSTESLDVLSIGCECSRVRKTSLAARMPQTRTMLNVCMNPASGGRNCSRCSKCLRTLATLDLLGIVEEFDAVFDLGVYRGLRTEYLMLLPNRTDDPFIRELYEFSRTPEARVPRSVSKFFAIWPLIKGPARAAKALKRFVSKPA